MPITPQQVQVAQSIQHTAAHDIRDQVRLVAGPGTGKSFAIEERVRWLIAGGVNPRAIFVVSFTRAAARDLRARIYNYCTAHGVTTVTQVSVTTLHSLALRILRAAGLLAAYPAEPIVMDQWELENIFDSEFSRLSDFTPTRCAEIRREHEAFWSTGQWGPPNYIPPNPPITQDERTRFNQFHGPRTQIYSCVLPGEIVRQCVQSISAGTLDPVSQLHIEHLIVDEFQDLNPCDLEFVDHLIQRGVTTFVAGDDDQSIYSFRFASPQGIQAFTNQYPATGNHTLNDCFRCAPAVVHVALSVITAHPLPNRIPKALNSLYRSANPPLQGQIHRWHFPRGVVESRAIVESCRDLIQAGIPPREILILISNRNVLERDLTQAFDAVQIPYEPPKSDSYTDLPEGRLTLACLRVVCNSTDYVAHRVILGLLQGIGIVTCNNIASAVLQGNLNFRDIFYQPLPAGVFNGRELRALNAARRIFAQISQWQPTETLAQRSADIEILLDTVLGDPARQAWVSNTSHLPRDITLQEVRDYLWADTDEQQVEILNAVYQRIGQPLPEEGVLPQRVRMMTMHGAKGLSAQIVFIPGLEEEIFPGQRRRPYPGLILEAARLLYVSVSRARTACILSYADSRVIHGQFTRHAASRFTNNLGGAFGFRQSGGLSQQEVLFIAQECSLI
ncbi:MAG: ATP-dependent helicase [Candidatus Tectomicrobia bacterium]|nr:ATP-dependent helicase [Candidatus Tectomicrobia bacterium]